MKQIKDEENATGKSLHRISRLFRRSHNARSAAANSLTASGTSLVASGALGQKSTDSLMGGISNTDIESIQKLDALLIASRIGGNAIGSVGAGVKALDDIINAIDAAENENLKSFDIMSIDKLRLAAETFTNSSWPSNLGWLAPITIPDMVSPPDIITTCEDISKLLQLAANASHQVRIRPDIAQDIFIPSSDADNQAIGTGQAAKTREIRLPRTLAGLSKPTDVKFIVDTIDNDDGGVIVIAIRGSRTWVDWIVNFDCGLVDAETMLGIEGIKAHGGLYAVASLMRQQTLDALKKQIGYPECLNKAGKKPRLLFTGHSAGGAVAALLWGCAIASKYHSQQKGLENFSTCFHSMNCITFGAPPVTEPALLPCPKINASDPEDIMMSVVNEGDPVPRSDFVYYKVLLQIYAHETFSDPDYLGRLLALPAMSLKNAGTIIGLRVIEPETSQPYTKSEVRSVTISSTIMEKYLAVNPLAHSMDLYASNVVACINQDIPSLIKKKHVIRELVSYEAFPTLDAESIQRMFEYGGFKEWWEAEDLDCREKWMVSRAEPDGWIYCSRGFDLTPPGKDSDDRSLARAIEQIQAQLDERQRV